MPRMRWQKTSDNTWRLMVGSGYYYGEVEKLNLNSYIARPMNGPSNEFSTLGEAQSYIEGYITDVSEEYERVQRGMG